MDLDANTGRLHDGRRFPTLACGTRPTGIVLRSLGASPCAGNAGVVCEISESDLSVWLDWDCRSFPAIGTSLSAARLRCVDSPASGENAHRGADARGEIWRRIPALSTENLVLIVARESVFFP